MFGRQKKQESKPAMTEQEFMASQNQVQPIVQQVQPSLPVQIQRQAMIVGCEILEDGEYAFKVVTNYPLGFGNCQLTQ